MELESYSDKRGWLSEFFRQDKLGKEKLPQMGYISMTEPGMQRGPHEHRCQTDIFIFLGLSEFELYLWDNRPESKTFQQKDIIKIHNQKLVRVIIPKGIVHGYKNIGNHQGIIINIPNQLYKGQGRDGEIDEIRYEQDPDSPFKIE
ncbi:MAG: dTDP-4-dehydrorhamnose 3,5-epimerase family protein [candidate division Zixibacteria bacterium]|nr:dTDP-4-dehydrorhamnose 3,5-epimerase family protein [candidate division Zixibacteria bacterium]